jgi:hypothetical protein
MKIYETLQKTTNFNPDKEENMALFWSYLKESHWINREVGTRLEPPGGSKVQPSQKGLEEDGQGRSHGTGEDKEQG